MEKRPGEFFLFGFEGTRVTPFLRKAVIEEGLGGVILFGRNLGSAREIAALCGTLQGLRSEVSDTPLWIAIDQEGGAVIRYRCGEGDLPGNMALGASASEDLARRAGAYLAAQLLPLGVNLNFAPVLDVLRREETAVIGTRSFGSDPESVSALGVAMIRGMEGAGLPACAKHFPGLGSSPSDPHLALPSVDDPAEVMREVHLVPFRAASDAGVASIMVSNALYPSLGEGEAPACLSPRITGEILRGDVGYRGMVVTDDFAMGALASLAPEEAAVAALRAGSDLLLISGGRDEQERALRGAKEAVGGGAIPEGVLDGKLERISEAKGGIGRRIAPPPDPGLPREIAEAALTARGILKGALPLRGGDRLCLLVPIPEGAREGEDATVAARLLTGALARRGLTAESAFLGPEPSAGEIEASSGAVRRSERVLLLTFNLHGNPAQIRVLEGIIGSGKPCLTAALRDPFDLAIFPRAGGVATYGWRACSIRALVRFLFGEIGATGRFPVELRLQEKETGSDFETERKGL